LQETLSVRRMNAMVFIFLVANFSLFEPREVAAEAGGGVLICIALATLAGLILTWVWFALARRFPGTDIVRYSLTALGTPLGQAAGAVYLFTLLLSSARPVAKVGTLGASAFGWGTAASVAAILAATALLAVLAGRGLALVGSLCEYAAPAAVFLVATAAFSVMARANWSNYSFTGWGPVVEGTLTLTGRFALAYVILFLLPRTRDTGLPSMLSTMGTVLLTGMMMAAGSLSVALYGAWTTGASFLPSLRLLTDSIWGRNPVVLSAVIILWMLGLTLRGATAGWLLMNALADTSAGTVRRYVVPVAATALIMGLVLWNDPGQTYQFQRQGLTIFSYTAGIVIPLLVLVAGRLRRGRIRPAAGEI